MKTESSERQWKDKALKLLNSCETVQFAVLNMADVSSYEIQEDNVGIVRTYILQIIREVANQPGGKILKEKININQGTKHLPSILQELSHILDPSEWSKEEYTLDLALCLERKLHELRKAQPNTCSWIPVSLVTEQISGFLQVLGSKLCSKTSACDPQGTPSKRSKLNYQIYSPNDNNLNQTPGVSSTNVTSANTTLCVTTADNADGYFTGTETLSGTSSIQVTNVSEIASFPTILTPQIQHETLQNHNPTPTKNERTDSILPTGTSQRVHGRNGTETQVSFCATSDMSSVVFTTPETLNVSTSTIQETNVSDNVVDSLLTTSEPSGSHTETFQYSGAALTENVQSATASFYPVSALVSDTPNTRNSIVHTEGPDLPQHNTDMSTSIALSSTKPPTGQQASSSSETMIVTLAQPTVIENMTSYKTHAAMGAHSGNLQLAPVNPGSSLMWNSTAESTRGGSLTQTSRELMSANALLSLDPYNVNQNPEMMDLSAHGNNSTAAGVNSVGSQELMYPSRDNKTSTTATGLTEGTSGHTGDSSQDLLSLSISECDVNTRKNMPASGEELKQLITCRSKSNPRKRCQYCEDLEDADIKLYAEIRSMSKRKKEMTIRKYIKSSAPKSKGKGKRHVSNEYRLPYRHGNQYRVCRETFVKYFNTCRNTIGKIVCQIQHGEDDTDTDSDSDGVAGRSPEDQEGDDESVIQADLKNHIKEFLSDQFTITPVNIPVYKTKYIFYEDVDDLVDEYNKARKQTWKPVIGKRLFKEVMKSVNIEVLSLNDTRLYWNSYDKCRICDLLQNNAAGESSEQQLKQHQEDADRVNRYCDRVMATQGEQGVLDVYMEVKDPDSLGCMEIPLFWVTIGDLNNKESSYFMWEFVRSGFGNQHLLSCLKCYLGRRLAESPVRRIVLITRPHGGLLRNTDLIGLFLWVMARYGVKDVQVVYEYYGHDNISVEIMLTCQAIQNINNKYFDSEQMLPLQEIIKAHENCPMITCMVASNMLNFTDTKNHISATIWDTIQESLNTTRWLHMTRHESMCDVIMSRYFSDAADDAGMNRVPDFCVPLPPAKTELTPLYSSGYRLPAEWYRLVMEVGLSKVKEYIRTHVQVDESDTRKVLPDPAIVLQETDGLEEKE